MLSCKGYAQALLLSLIVWQSACQPIPRPFQPLDKSLYFDRSAIDRNYSLSLQGIEGAGLDLEQRLLSRLGVELGKLNILSSHSTASSGNFLVGGKLVRSDDNGVQIYWEIFDPSGDIVAMFEQAGSLHGQKIGRLAQDAASRIQALLSGQPKKPFQILVFVPPVDGAPGDGRSSLTSAMRTSLAVLKITVITELQADSISLLGSVITVRQDNEDLVEINWSLISDDGQEVALITQSDSVPAGTLDGAWGQLAQIIAEAASQDVAWLIRDYLKNLDESL